MIKNAKQVIKYSFNSIKNIIQRPIIVLLYHRVIDLEFDPQLLSVSVENFHEQLLYLKENYEILRLEDEWVKKDKPAIVITFDDGYADNYQNALPILEDLKIPATFFITTGMIGSDKEFWWDSLERLILIPKEFPSEIELQVNGKTHSWNMSSNNTRINSTEWNVLSEYELSSRCQFYKDLHILLKPLSNKERSKVLTAIANKSSQQEKVRSSHRTLSRDELVSMASSDCVTIGAHTRSHSQLSNLNILDQKDEILTSKQTIEKWLKQPVSVFAYPYGTKADYNLHSISICRKAKFLKVASNYPGQLHSWTNPMQIPRQIVRNWDLGEFQNKLNSFINN